LFLRTGTFLLSQQGGGDTASHRDDTKFGQKLDARIDGRALTSKQLPKRCAVPQRYTLCLSIVETEPNI